jgi:hypothetical protein
MLGVVTTLADAEKEMTQALDDLKALRARVASGDESVTPSTALRWRFVPPYSGRAGTAGDHRQEPRPNKRAGGCALC